LEGLAVGLVDRAFEGNTVGEIVVSSTGKADREPEGCVVGF
jgi:hypothetical protein